MPNSANRLPADALHSRRLRMPDFLTPRGNRSNPHFVRRVVLQSTAMYLAQTSGRAIKFTSVSEYPWNQNSIAAHAYELELLAGQRPPIYKP